MWYVYIVKCSDETYYTGITNNLSRRIERHLLGRGSKYTRGRLPVELVYYEQVINRSIASKREAIIKKLNKFQKENLISYRNAP